MAAPTDIELVRSLAGVSESDYDDAYIEDLIERSGTEYGAVSIIWHIKAAQYASSVAAASGSTRIELQQRYEHAVDRAEYYEGLSGGLGDSASMVSVTMAPAYDDEMTEYTWPEGVYWPAAGVWAAWERMS